MKSITKLTSVTKENIQQLSAELKQILFKEDFIKYVKPYNEFGRKQLDDIYLIAQVTIKGNGQVVNLIPNCTVDQENWHDYEDEPDIRINPVNIPFKLLTPQTPLNISTSKTFFAVLQSEKNIWDSCKYLPDWIWDERKFEFILSFTIKTEDGNIHHGNSADEYANKLIEF